MVRCKADRKIYVLDRRIKMHERLSNKNETPDVEHFLTHIGSGKEGFEIIDNYLTSELKTVKNIYFDAHNKGWAIRYYIKIYVLYCF